MFMETTTGGDGEPSLPLYQPPATNNQYGQIPRPQFPNYQGSPWQLNTVSEYGQKQRPEAPFNYVEPQVGPQRPNTSSFYPSGQYSAVNYYGQNSYQPTVPKPSYSYGYGPSSNQDYGQSGQQNQNSDHNVFGSYQYGQPDSKPSRPYRPHGQPSIIQSQFANNPGYQTNQHNYGPVETEKQEKLPNYASNLVPISPSKPSYFQKKEKENSYGPPPYLSQSYGQQNRPSNPPPQKQEKEPSYDFPPFTGQSYGQQSRPSNPALQKEENEAPYGLPPFIGQSYGQQPQPSKPDFYGERPVAQNPSPPKPSQDEIPPSPFVQNYPTPKPPLQIEIPLPNPPQSPYSGGSSQPNSGYGQKPVTQNWAGPFSPSYLDNESQKPPINSGPWPASPGINSKPPQGQYQSQVTQAEVGYQQRPSAQVPPVVYGQRPLSPPYQPQGSNIYEQPAPAKPAFESAGPQYQVSSGFYGQHRPSYEDLASNGQRPPTGPNSLAAFIYGQANFQAPYGQNLPQPTQEAPTYDQLPPKESQSSGPVGQPLADETPVSQPVPPLLLEQPNVGQAPLPVAAAEPLVSNTIGSNPCNQVVKVSGDRTEVAELSIQSGQCSVRIEAPKGRLALQLKDFSLPCADQSISVFEADSNLPLSKLCGKVSETPLYLMDAASARLGVNSQGVKLTITAFLW